ncbi:YkvA family protein [uncultured Brachyspira sp.]|uniref:DUF1232 domain-containing protein n=1 Tax=uncultured Brachyspira sp. TaxID=221953 RepID=UPI0025F3F436|nr:YkvA family protein [uncultured Brachyspira sp.]
MNNNIGLLMNNNNNNNKRESEIVNYASDKKQNTFNSVISWIPFVLALLYTVSPADFIFDIIPVLGLG